MKLLLRIKSHIRLNFLQLFNDIQICSSIFIICEYMYGVLTALGSAGQNVYVKHRRKVVVSEVLNLYVSLLRFLWRFFFLH